MLGVHLTDGVVTVGSLIGLVTVLGIATRNGILLVSHVRHLRDREGVTGLREAVERGAMERLAPILMTALTTGLALVPLALGGDKPGNEIQTPMAVVILCGLLSSTVLNMLVLPALYLRFGRRGEGDMPTARSLIAIGIKPSPTGMERSARGMEKSVGPLAGQRRGVITGGG